jgi:hypothetical protein
VGLPVVVPILPRVGSAQEVDAFDQRDMAIAEQKVKAFAVPERLRFLRPEFEGPRHYYQPFSAPRWDGENHPCVSDGEHIAW